MTIHELKTLPLYFAQLENGSKTFEVRKNDRHFQSGDVLFLKEWEHTQPSTMSTLNYTGAELWYEITYVLTDHESIVPGYAILAIKSLKQIDPS
jgi:hypothetical protein